MINTAGMLRSFLRPAAQTPLLTTSQLHQIGTEIVPSPSRAAGRGSTYFCDETGASAEKAELGGHGVNRTPDYSVQGNRYPA